MSYISSQVSEEASDFDVQVVPMSPETVRTANRQAYSPRNLPSEFYQVAGGGNLRGIGALPEPPVFPTLQPSPLALQPPPPVTIEPYRLGTGDGLRLMLAQSVEVDPITGASESTTTAQEMTVRDDGTISIPLVGSVTVAGLTVEDAEAEVFSRLIDAEIDPTFSLEVSQFNSQRVSVGGAVGEPRIVPLTLNTLDLGQALTAAGGVQAPDPEYASIRIYRDGRLYQIPLSEFFDRSELQNLPVLSGDAIYVDTTYDLDRAQAFYESQINVIALERSGRTTALAELSSEIGLRRAALNEARSNFQAREALGAVQRDYVYLTGEVSDQSRWPLPYGQQASLADVLYDSGGFDTLTGNPAHIYVLRSATSATNDAAVTAWHLDVRNAVSLTMMPLFEMRPNDIVFIEEQPITRWNRAIQQSIPAFITTVASAVN